MKKIEDMKKIEEMTRAEKLEYIENELNGTNEVPTEESEYIDIKLNGDRVFRMLRADYKNNIENGKDRYVVMEDKLVMVNEEDEKVLLALNNKMSKMSRRERRKLNRK